MVVKYLMLAAALSATILVANCRGGDGYPASTATGKATTPTRPALADLPSLSSLDPSTIITVAGVGSIGDGGPATSARLSFPLGVTLNGVGNLFISDSAHQRVRMVDAVSGIITTVAGTGEEGFSGDGGPATNAKLSSPLGLAVDGAGNLFISDLYNHRVRRVDAMTGVITTVAGTGQEGFGGDGGPASIARLNSPLGLVVDGGGNLFIADGRGARVRRVDAATGFISTVAGTGEHGFRGDGGLATSARLSSPRGVAVDSAGNLFITELSNQRVRRVDVETGVITTVAGIGEGGFGGDGGPATRALLNTPTGVAVDGAGNLFIAEMSNRRVRRVAAETGVITTVAGTGQEGFGGDGGPAISAVLKSPSGLAIDGVGNLFIADQLNRRVRRVDAVTGVITTVAGAGGRGFIGDGGPATRALLNNPSGVVLDGEGNLFIADWGYSRVRRVDAVTGVITTVAGTDVEGFGGDGGPATRALLLRPTAVAMDGAGNLFIADWEESRIRQVDALTGVISTVAGTGEEGFRGDGGPASSAWLSFPQGVAVDGAGNLFISDWGNNRIRRVDAVTGVITTVAGTGEEGFQGDGGPATSALLSSPQGVAVDGAGNLFFADTRNGSIRRVDVQTGVITTVAGTGEDGFGGDGGLATRARLSFPLGVAVDGAGNLFIADQLNRRIRRVDGETGIITTVAGTGEEGFGGDGDQAAGALFNRPTAVAVDAAGNLFISDTGADRVRAVSAP